MIKVEDIALWTGLFASVVGIVLSIVAIVFSILVDKRSSKISDQTIQSLQKIESAVERLSGDTRDLIKAGWDKMLGNVDRQSGSSADTSAKEIAQGIAAELRADLEPSADKKGSDKSNPEVSLPDVEKLLKNLESSLTTQIRAARLTSRPAEAIDRMISTLSGMTPEAQAITMAIRKGHLSRQEYRSLLRGPLGSAVGELRDAGIVIPVVHHTPDGKEDPCYYFPPDIARAIRAATDMLPRQPLEVREIVKSELKRIGYPSDNGHANPPVAG